MHNNPMDSPGRGWLSGRVLGGAFFAVTAGLLGGCAEPGGTKASDSTIASRLLAELPNLKPLGIDSCRFTVETGSAPSGLPSPSDSKVEVRGWAGLSEEGAKALKSGFPWKAVRREDIPPSLLAIVPQGNLLTSQTLNDSFAGNHPRLTHGFLVTPAAGGWRRVYFVATDMDHPIK